METIPKYFRSSSSRMTWTRPRVSVSLVLTRSISSTEASDKDFAPPLKSCASSTNEPAFSMRFSVDFRSCCNAECSDEPENTSADRYSTRSSWPREDTPVQLLVLMQPQLTPPEKRPALRLLRLARCIARRCGGSKCCYCSKCSTDGADNGSHGAGDLMGRGVDTGCSVTPNV